jgi:hypothetical protein
MDLRARKKLRDGGRQTIRHRSKISTTMSSAGSEKLPKHKRVS